MLIATFALGDMVTTLTKRKRISTDDVDTYILTNTDIATGNTYSKSYLHENAAVRAFCACISSDEPDLTEDLNNLRTDPAIVPFLA